MRDMSRMFSISPSSAIDFLRMISIDSFWVSLSILSKCSTMVFAKPSITASGDPGLPPDGLQEQGVLRGELLAGGRPFQREDADDLVPGDERRRHREIHPGGLYDGIVFDEVAFFARPRARGRYRHGALRADHHAPDPA